ncbi:hypothetical protein HanPSC8_Chr09g0357641 [Helianthus annuus]|nr:hypothetical protein HanPSC8_Chr09g0357641 [Helianthus annuus]
MIISSVTSGDGGNLSSPISTQAGGLFSFTKCFDGAPIIGSGGSGMVVQEVEMSVE